MQSVYDNFLSLDIRVGRILAATLRNDLRQAAIELDIDFGETIGVLKSSAQITDLYQAESLVGTLVSALVNISPRQIANIISQCLVLGYKTEEGVVLVRPDQNLPLGSKLA